VPSHLDRRVEASRDADAAGEIPAGPEREDGELGRRSEIGREETVDDLVDGPVPADEDEPRRSARDRLSGQLAEVARTFGDQRLAAETGRRDASRELGPPPAGRPARRRRIDEEDGANARR
jgi:hypothetical protein